MLFESIIVITLKTVEGFLSVITLPIFQTQNRVWDDSMALHKI